MTRALDEHLVRMIRFIPGTNDGPCECACGWEGKASQHAQHRKDIGAQGGARLPDPYTTSTVWKRGGAP